MRARSWIGYSCTESVFTRYGYSAADGAAIVENCADTCGMCDTSARDHKAAKAAVLAPAM